LSKSLDLDRIKKTRQKKHRAACLAGHRILLTALLCAAGHIALAQVGGTVRDAASGRPVAGATVASSTDSTQTDDSGRFRLARTAVGDTVHVRYIGYESHAGVIGSAKMDIRLVPAQGRIGEVRVIGLTESQREVRKIRESVMPVTVLTGKEIENRASDLNEILTKQVGVQVRRTGGLGSEARISVRGLEGNRVKVYIDEAPLNTPDGSLGINDIPVEMIERIEIYKGTVPAYLGGDGLGSAVNVVLKHVDVSYIDASASYQSHNTVTSELILKKSFDRQGTEAGIAVHSRSSDNDYEMELPTQPGTFVRRDHDGYRSLMVGGVLRTGRLWFDKLEAEGVYMAQKKEMQGIQRNIQHARTEGDTHVLSFLAEKRLHGGRTFLKYGTVWAELGNRFIDTSSYSYDWAGNRTASIYGRGEEGIGPNLSDNKTQEWRQSLNLNHELSPMFTLNLNSELRRARFRPHDEVGNRHAGRNLYNYPGSLFGSTTGLTLETRLREDRWLLSAALKHYHEKVTGHNTNIYLSTEPPEVQSTTNRIGWNAGVRYRLRPALMAKASYENALRLPLNNELFGDGAFITPAIALRPERADNFTAGIIYDRTDDQDRRLQLEANAFYMFVDDMIQLAGAVTRGYVNYAKVDIMGADAEVRYDVSRHVYASANLTWQRLRDAQRYIPGTDGVPSPTYGLQVPYVPELFANAMLEYSLDGLLGPPSSQTRLMYEGSFVKKYSYGFAMSIYDDFSIPGHLAHNIILEQSFRNKRYVLTAEAHNITGEHILNNWRMPLPGRTFRIKLRCVLK